MYYVYLKKDEKRLVIASAYVYKGYNNFDLIFSSTSLKNCKLYCIGFKHGSSFGQEIINGVEEFMCENDILTP